MYFALLKLVILVVLVNYTSCAEEENNKPAVTNAADFRLNMLLHHLKSLNKLSNTDAEARNDRIRMNFIKLRPIIRRLLDLDNEDSSTNLVETEDDYEPVAVAGVATTGSDSENGIRVSRRAQFYYSSPAVSSGEQQRVIDFHRFIKGKRVKSMYGSSGLQGVWGVPGK